MKIIFNFLFLMHFTKNYVIMKTIYNKTPFQNSTLNFVVIMKLNNAYLFKHFMKEEK